MIAFSLFCLPQQSSSSQGLTFPLLHTSPVVQERQGEFRIEIPGLPSIANPGEPALPVRTVFILLPPGQVVDSIWVSTLNRQILPGRFLIPHGQSQRPLCHQGPWEKTPPDHRIYSSPDPFPSQKYHLVGTWTWCGYRVAVVNLYPVEVIPAAGTIAYFPKMELHLELEDSPHLFVDGAKMLRPNETMTTKLANLVENPALIGSYRTIYGGDKEPGGLQTLLADTYPYLIITDQSLTSAFQTLADFKTARGQRARVMTTQEIDAAMSGNDLQEKIRNSIIEAYTSWQTQFVLLGGDDEMIPHRGFYAQAFGYTEEDIPADLYYAALDGDWDEDGDGLWGEVGEEDLFPEVSLGRAPVDCLAEADQFVSKIILYQASPVIDQTTQALLAGEKLWDIPQTWGGDFKDEIRLGSSADGYTTVGFPPDFSIETLYDRDLGSPWWGGLLLNEMNDGLHLINHMGHTAVDRALRLSAEQVLTDLSNDGIADSYFMIYSQGCYAAAFDNRNPGGSYLDDCVAEAFVAGPHGAVAFIGNSRYGWAEAGDPGGASQMFDRQFFDGLFGEELRRAGELNTDSKLDNLWAIDYEGVRWCYYELNLLGDPELQIWTTAPGSLSVTHADGVQLNWHNFIDVRVESGGQKIQGATVCLRQGDDIYTTKQTNPVGRTYFIVKPTTPDTLDISVTAPDCLPYHNAILVRATGPSLWYAHHLVDDDCAGSSRGNNNGIVDHGETIELAVWLANFGNQTAEDISAILSTTDSYVVLLDSIQTYADIAPEEEGESSGYYLFSVDANCPDGHQIEFTITAFSDEGQIGISTFRIPISSPKLIAENMVFSDNTPEGNGNGILEPNESAVVSITIRNIGSGSAESISGELSVDDPFVQIVRDFSIYSSLDSGSTSYSWPVYKITTSSEIPSLHLFDYSLDLTARSGYSTCVSVLGYLGAIGLKDDMEESTTTWNVENLWHISEERTYSPFQAWYAGDDSLGGYPPSIIASLTSEPFFLIPGSVLSFWHWFDLEEGADFGSVEILDGGEWIELDGSFTGNSGGWTRQSYDLSTFPDSTLFQIRFLLTSDEENSGEGWYIDDVAIGPPQGFWLENTVVTPQRGIQGEIFSFGATYFSGQDYPPSSAQVFIDNVPYSLNTEDISCVQGARYSYQTDLDLGHHEYHFEFRRGLEKTRWPRLGELSGPLVTETIYEQNFEQDDGNYTVEGGNWEWGSPGSGPGSAHSGEYVWATALNGEYSNLADSRLETPSISLVDVKYPQLSFWHWYSFEDRAGNYDGANVKISVDGGNEFSIIDPEDGYEGTISPVNYGIPYERGFYTHDAGQYWHQEVFDLSSFSDQQIIIRFHFGSNVRHVYPGWYIDDVSVTGLELIPHPVSVCSLRATPHHGDIHLRWSWPAAESPPAEYAVYRGLLSSPPLFEPELIAVVSDTVYLDVRAANDPEANYYYLVRALDTDGQPLLPSESVGEFDVTLEHPPTR